MKKGFTLAELSVAMAVIAIATAMLALCFVSINNFSERKERQTEISREISSFQKTLNTTLQSYTTSEYALVENSTFSNQFQIIKGSEIFLFTLNNEAQYLVLNANDGDEILFKFKYIEEVKFQTSTNLIRCTVFCDEKEYILVFNI